jgi:hypothetical protein
MQGIAELPEPKSLAEFAAEANGSARGIECPGCGCRDFRTRRTNPRDGRIQREKYCRHCGRKIVTVEKPLDGTYTKEASEPES